MQEIVHPIPEHVLKVLKRQHYAVVGLNTGVKLCDWLRKSLLDRGVCYKQDFYGIQSHRCLQMSPSVIWCTHRCIYCWRIQSGDEPELRWKEYPFPEAYDDPEFIVENAVKAQRQLISGYKPFANPRKYVEALNPNQAAISLSGEPTLYPVLGDLIHEFHRRHFTTFLVTNGTMPERLESLSELPTQLYITLPAPRREVYLKTSRPIIRDGWDRIQRSLEIMSTVQTRTVIRMTLTKGLNFREPEGYAKLIEKANPMFVELKAAMALGYARKRGMEDRGMLLHWEIREFAEELSKIIGYRLAGEKLPSRVVLLTRIKGDTKIPGL